MLTQKEWRLLSLMIQAPAMPQGIKRGSGGGGIFPRPLNIHAFQWAIQRAWGLHREVSSRTLAATSSLSALDGNTRRRRWFFDTIETCAQVTDLSIEKRTEAFGKALGN